MKNIVTHNYAPLRSTFVRCCISEVVGVDVKQRAPQQNSKIQYVTRYGILRHYTATFTFRRQKYKHTTTNKYEVLQLRHVVQLKIVVHVSSMCIQKPFSLFRLTEESTATSQDQAWRLLGVLDLGASPGIALQYQGFRVRQSQSYN